MAYELAFAVHGFARSNVMSRINAHIADVSRCNVMALSP